MCLCVCFCVRNSKTKKVCITNLSQFFPWHLCLYLYITFSLLKLLDILMNRKLRQCVEYSSYTFSV